MLRTRRPLLALLLLGVLLAAGYLLSFVDTDEAAPGTAAPGATATSAGPPTAGPTRTAATRTAATRTPATRTAVATRTPATRTSAPARTPADGLGTVRAAELPSEARRVLRLIDAGGPFPYDQDGSVFGNYERLLPAKTRGWYREYTVPTPGERDRGARRIVAGRDGTLYWTADHYDSFARIDQ